MELAATGSHAVVAEDVFVPEYRSLPAGVFVSTAAPGQVAFEINLGRYPRDKPGAGKARARIREGESRMTELLAHDLKALLWLRCHAVCVDLSNALCTDRIIPIRLCGPKSLLPFSSVSMCNVVLGNHVVTCSQCR